MLVRISETAPKTSLPCDPTRSLPGEVKEEERAPCLPGDVMEFRNGDDEMCFVGNGEASMSRMLLDV